ncbi:MAG: alpha-L-fucosidase [Flavobacteriales bacterium]|nr:alpha-L-fucosidase [Flavobacteriales bacterium]
MNTERTVRFPLTLSLLFPFALHAQSPYVPPADPAVAENLAAWQDLKFGLLMHWGPYSQWGVVESWSICPEDEGWCRRDSSHGKTYNEYVRNYEALQTTFDPVQFDPAKWARAAKEAGMKYLVFTTKHHDGFCMFDTKTTDYRITSPNTPFHDDPRANVTKGIFTAFRNEGLWTGAYFSKPDWHSDAYWWRNFPPKDRSVNYLPMKYPERWKAFQDLTYTQIEELMTGYGPVDILWLDGGWVRPFTSIDTSVSWQKAITIEQDIDMPRIAAMARSHQPGLLVVDRTVGGEFENYITPEGHVPEEDPGVPWETCMPMGTSWSWVPNEKYKSTDEIIRTLVKVVTRGGSLLLNVAPGPDGQLDSVAYVRLKEVGEWMRLNGEAIHSTTPTFEHKRTTDIGSTSWSEPGCYRNCDVNVYYFIDSTGVGDLTISCGVNATPRAYVLGSKKPLEATPIGNRTLLHIPRSALPGEGPVWVIKLSGRSLCRKY